MSSMKQLLHFATSPYGIICIIVSSYVFIMAVWNLLYKLRIAKRSSCTNGPLVSVCIPVRDEEENIRRCLDSLLKQTYTNMEIIVCDDGSTDGTWRIVQEYQQKYSALRGLKAGDKPRSWKGKSFALQQCADHARGDILYTTDADTIHAQEAVAWAVDKLEKRKLDAFTAMPRQITRTFGEKLVVSMVYLPAFLAPMAFLNWQRLKGCVFAIGQIFVFRARAFHAVGGLKPVRGNITEDVAMARVLRKAGYRYEFLDARGHVECRMYGSFKASVRGFLKNFYEIVSFAPYLIVFGLVIGIIALFLFPPFSAAVFTAGALFGGGFGAAGAVFVIPVLLFILSWGINLWYYRTAFYLAILYPIFFIIIAVMLCLSLVQVLSGKEPVWKARAVEAPTSPKL